VVLSEVKWFVNTIIEFCIKPWTWNVSIWFFWRSIDFYSIIWSGVLCKSDLHHDILNFLIAISNQKMMYCCVVSHYCKNGKLFIYTCTCVHKLQYIQQCHTVVVSMSASVIFPLTRLWKILEQIKTGIRILTWYYMYKYYGHSEKWKKSFILPPSYPHKLWAIPY